MQYRNTKESYGRISIALHWTIAVLVLCMLLAGYVMEFVLPERLEDVGDAIEFYHMSIGFVVLALMIFRLLWSLAFGLPDLAADLEGWEAKASKAAHWALYALLIAMPIAGYLSEATAGREGEPERTLPFFAPGMVPNLVGRNHGLHEIMEDTHLYLSFAIVAVLAVHMGAAWKHHFVRGDGVLARMLPHLDKPHLNKKD